MLSGESTFVAPELISPSNEDWTQVIEQGNTYTLTIEPESNSIEARSTAKIHSLGFVFNAVHSGGDTDDSFEPLRANVKVLTDGVIYKEYSYLALPPGQVSVPLSETISLN